MVVTATLAAGLRSVPSCFATSKSVITGTSSAVINTFSGFRSRCSTPLCAAAGAGQGSGGEVGQGGRQATSNKQQATSNRPRLVGAAGSTGSRAHLVQVRQPLQQRPQHRHHPPRPLPCRRRLARQLLQPLPQIARVARQLQEPAAVLLPLAYRLQSHTHTHRQQFKHGGGLVKRN